MSARILYAMARDKMFLNKALMAFNSVPLDVKKPALSGLFINNSL